MNINYFLDKKLNRKGEAQIFLYLRKSNTQVKISTGLKLLPKQWDYKKQEARSVLIGCPEFNAFLANIKAIARNKYLECVAKHKGDEYWLKGELNEHLGMGRSNKKEQRLIKELHHQMVK